MADCGGWTIAFKNADGITADEQLHDLDPNMSILDVKRMLAESYPGQPPASAQKIVFAGRCVCTLLVRSERYASYAAGGGLQRRSFAFPRRVRHAVQSWCLRHRFKPDQHPARLPAQPAWHTSCETNPLDCACLGAGGHLCLLF
jgi:hypothetical protein